MHPLLLNALGKALTHFAEAGLSVLRTRADQWGSATNVAASPLAPGESGDSPFAMATALPSLWAAWQRVRNNDGAPGADGISTGAFAHQAPESLLRLRGELCSARWLPGPLRRTMAPCLPSSPSSGRIASATRCRLLQIPTIRDRIVHTALLTALQSRLDPRFHPCSCGWRPGRSCHDAVRLATRLVLKEHRPWVIRTDVRECFESLPHSLLHRLLAEAIDCPRTLALLRRGFPPLRSAADQGVPTGSPLSPLLANIVMDHAFDQPMADNAIPFVRYGDDILLATHTKREAEAALADVRRSLRAAGLLLNEQKTAISHVPREGFDFLGFRFSRGEWHPAPGGIARLAARLNRLLTGKGAGACTVAADASANSWLAYYEPIAGKRAREAVKDTRVRGAQAAPQDDRYPSAVDCQNNSSSG